MDARTMLMINEETERQKKLHPGWNEENLDRNCRILGGEFGEVCEAVKDVDVANLHAELIQVATFAIRWAEHLQKGQK